MGGNESSPETDGRTRAYSSSDVPSSSGGVAGFRYTNGPDGPQIRYSRGNHPSSYVGVSIPSNGRSGSHGLGRNLDDMDDGSEMSGGGHRLFIGSLPAHLSSHLLGGFCCPVCSKYVVSSEVEQHLLICLTKPGLSYNGASPRPVLSFLCVVLFSPLSRCLAPLDGCHPLPGLFSVLHARRLRGRSGERLRGMCHLSGGAGAGRYHCQAALSLYLPQRVYRRVVRR